MSKGTKPRLRTCIGCGEQSGKVELKRIVRCSDETVKFDPSGRAAGRGAYICSEKCLEVAVKAKKIQRALRCDIAKEELEALLTDIRKAMLEGEKR